MGCRPSVVCFKDVKAVAYEELDPRQFSSPLQYCFEVPVWTSGPRGRPSGRPASLATKNTSRCRPTANPILSHHVTRSPNTTATWEIRVSVYSDYSFIDRKIRRICNILKPHAWNRWFAGETVRSILRLRGIESKLLRGYGEAHCCPKRSTRKCAWILVRIP